MIVNYFNPEGISLVREKIELKWAPDSLFKNSLEDTDADRADSSALMLTKIENLVEVAKQEEEIVKLENDPVTEKKDKTIEENKKIVSFSEPQAITLDQAYKLYTNDVMFVDARDEADYIAGHITNSINIPFDDFDNHKKKLELLSKNEKMVIYCAGTECDLSILLGNLLFEQGYKQIYVFFGGWNEWLEADYPVKQSSE